VFVTLSSDGVTTVGNINAASPFPSSINLNSTGGSFTTGSLDAGSIVSSFNNVCCGEPGAITVNGAIGGLLPGTQVSLSAGTLTVNGAVTLDPAAAGNALLRSSSGLLTVGGAITAGDGSSIALTSGSAAAQYEFTRIDAGATGSVSIDATGGMRQTLAAGSGGGITGATVSLTATGAGSAIEGTSPLTVRGATSLTISAGGSVDVTRVDGANPIPLLTNLDITRSDSTAAFSLTGFAAGQSATVTNVAGGVEVAATTPDGAPLRFRYQNTDGAFAALTGTGIASKGGEVVLETGNGLLTTGSISTVDPSVPGSGAQVLLNAAGNLEVSGTVDAGSGSVQATAAEAAGAGSLASTASVQITTNFGAIGNGGTHLAISAPAVRLTAATEAFASLTGTGDLQVNAPIGFTIATDTALTALAVTTTGAGAGPLTLAAPGQSFGLARNGTTVEVGTISSAAALDTLSVSVTGDLRLLGTGVASIAANSQSFFASNALTLDGSGARLVLSGTFQDFFSSGTLALNGMATLTSSGTQQLRASGALTVQAAGGDITMGAATQVLQGASIAITGGGAGEGVVATATASQSLSSAAGGITLTGGAGVNAPVTFTNSGAGTQSFSAGGGHLTLAAGTGNQSGVTVSATGSGAQSLFATGNVALTADALGAADAPVAVLKSGGNTQTMDANGSILLTGGAGLNGSVRVVQSGSGQQVIGDPFNSFDPTDNLTLQGGAGTNAFALVEAANRQVVRAAGAVQVRGGGGDGASARITTSLATSSSTTMGNASQVLGYNSGFDGFCGGGCASIASVEVSAGSGAGAIAEIASAGSQRVFATTVTTVTGSATDGGVARIAALSQDLRTGATTLTAGTGNNAHASLAATGSDADRPSGTAVLQFVDPAALTLNAGGTALANSASARVTSGGSQQVNSNPTALNAGVGPNSVAEITAVTSQTLSLGTLTLNAAAGGAGSAAQIVAGTTQSGSAGTTTLTGGANTGASARIQAGTTQNLSFGNLTMTGGSAQDTRASLIAASGQTISASTTQLTGGTGAAAGDAAALIANATGAQSVSTANLTIRSGADFAATGIVNGGTTQQINTSALSITTSAGANNLAGSGPLGNSYIAGIVSNGGAQNFTTSSITINNVDASGAIGIAGPAQLFNASGAITVQANAGAARIDSGSTQTFNASNGSLVITATGGTGSARVFAPGAQTVTTRFIDISTAAVATGNAELTAGGAQSVHTVNGTAGANGSLRVAALGTGTAKLQAGGAQLLEIDYPELMQGARDGRITVGNAAALGDSIIRAPSQDIFARSLTVLGGAAAGADAKVDVSGAQNISLVRSVFTAGAAGATVTGGAGGSALIDPTIQNILSAGPIAVAGGSGPGTVGGIVATGDQTILVTSTGAANISVDGGSGANAFGQITTTGLTQRLGTSGSLVLAAGTGANADAVIGAGFGGGETFYACGIAFTCNVPSLTSNPFLNTTAETGGFYTPQPLLLPAIVAGGVGAQSGDASLTSPFDPTVLTLWTLNLGGAGEEDETRLGRLLPVCR
jgi:hypothetical protein